MEWYRQQDELSVHVGINYRLYQCRLAKTKPVCILLGKYHTQLFMKEMGWSYIPRGPHLYGSKRDKILIKFNCSNINGIAIETEKRPP